MPDIDLKPTEEMAANAARGLELREKHGRGGTAVGVARARDISNRKNLSPDTVRRMNSYFARHAVDKQGEGWGKDSAGYIAWLLWGGDAGRAWAKRKSRELENKQENAMSEIGKQIAERLGAVAKFGAKHRSTEQTRKDARDIANDLDASYDIRAWSEDGIVFVDAANYERATKARQQQRGYNPNIRVMPYPPQGASTKSSRPGAKAEFGDVGSDDNKIRYLLGEAESAIAHMNISDARRIASEFVERAESLVQAKTPAELRNRIKRIKAMMSRPGAKSTNAADILKVEVMDGSTVTSSMTPSDFMAYAKRSLPGIGSTSSLPDMIARFNELAEEKGMRVRVRSNLAKSNNAIREGEKVSAGEDAVSRKIALLMREGYPQDQAVAIALDMERRGEL